MVPKGPAGAAKRRTWTPPAAAADHQLAPHTRAETASAAGEWPTVLPEAPTEAHSIPENPQKYGNAKKIEISCKPMKFNVFRGFHLRSSEPLGNHGNIYSIWQFLGIYPGRGDSLWHLLRPVPF